MQEVKQEIINYQATCLQEQQDQQQILHYLSLFDNLLSRANTIAHFTSSGFIVNRQHTKTLFIYHNIYQAWCWTGGHVDGESDFQAVALKEASEETGLQQLSLLSPKIASLDILPVLGHMKNNQWVSTHQHLSLAYVIEADEREPLIQNNAETTGLKWIDFAEIAEMSQEPEMLPIYQKLLTFISKEN